MKKLALVISLLFSVCAFAQIENVTPKRPSPPRLVNDFANTLTPEQAFKFVAAAENDRWYALWVVLLYGGLRPSEALGLCWSDVDFGAGIV